MSFKIRVTSFKKTMKVTAKLDNLRIAPRKSKLVADMIKGMDVLEALIQLDHRIKRSSLPVKKLLESAIANGENNFGLDKDNLFVFDAVVGAGPTLKRWKPKAFGRAGKIMKRTSKITIVLEERVEGKGRKSKEDMEKEREARMKKKAKEEKAIRERQKTEEKEEKEGKEEAPKATREARKKEEITRDNKEKSWTNRIFRRKSM